MIYLASQSPRRRELLAQLGIAHGVLEVDVPEVRLAGEAPEAYVSRVAREKAGAGLLKVLGKPGAVVLGADTEVVLDDKVFGKPVDREDAAAMLRELSGREHAVLSAVWVISAGEEQGIVHRSRVRFAALDDTILKGYLDSGEWQGKAGAYGIQGRAAAFIEHLEGSHSSVMGLPLHEAARLLRRFGVSNA